MRTYSMIILSALIFLFQSLFGQDCHVIDLQCEYLNNPIAVDVAHPRFSWILNDNRHGAFQYAYQLFVGTDSIDVANSRGSIWNSGKVKSDATLISFNGEELTPFTNYYWAVKVWDKNKKQHLSKVLKFRTGIKNQSNWQGSWITDSRDISLKPAACFRREFNISKEIKSAHAYIAAAGLFEFELNGKKVGDHRMDPIYTRFDRRNLYVTFDITNEINVQNAIGITLGNGWYNHQSTAVWYFHEAPWRARPRFCMDLRLEYIDGTVEVISTDRSWKTNLSPMVFNSIYTGEHYDANLELNGWSEVGFDDSKWRNSQIAQAPSQNIVSQQLYPIRAVEEITPVSIRKNSDRNYIFDLGRNIAGVTKLKVQGEPGTIIKVIHSELLNNDGNLDLSNINLHYRPTDDTDPFQTDIYTLKGDGVETFSPKFNYKGFQYVEVQSDKPIELNENSLVGLFMHSDVPPRGSIHSSNPILNQLWEATNNSYLSNLFGYPTDCPQREKNGWTGDAHIASETGLYNFDGITTYEKWLADHRDEQQPNGVLPSIVPSNGWGYSWGNGPDWASTIAIIPWNIYMFYGDSQLLEKCYPNIKRYVDHITEISKGNLSDWGLGDWIPVKSKTPVEFTSSIYYYVDVMILAKAAKLFGNEQDFQKYSTLAGNIKKAFNEKYFNAETGIYGEGNQTELSTALYWGMVPDAHITHVAKNLAEKVISDGRHIDIGLLGSKAILNALSDNGYGDLAYEIAVKETYPSWGYWMTKGMKTLPENWDLSKQTNDISHNHIMFCEVSAWFYKALGGIKFDPQKPGFKNILLEPNFVKGLEHFETKFNSPQGEIVSSWKRTENTVEYHVIIPANSTANLTVKASKIFGNVPQNIRPDKNGKIHLSLNSGTYDLKIVE